MAASPGSASSSRLASAGRVAGRCNRLAGRVSGGEELDRRWAGLLAVGTGRDPEPHPAYSDPVRAVAYLRVSTDDQAREGYSLDAQRACIRAYCAAKGYDLIREFEDDGFRDGR